MPPFRRYCFINLHGGWGARKAQKRGIRSACELALVVEHAGVTAPFRSTPRETFATLLNLPAPALPPTKQFLLSAYERRRLFGRLGSSASGLQAPAGSPGLGPVCGLRQRAIWLAMRGVSEAGRSRRRRNEETRAVHAAGVGEQPDGTSELLQPLWTLSCRRAKDNLVRLRHDCMTHGSGYRGLLQEGAFCERRVPVSKCRGDRQFSRNLR